MKQIDLRSSAILMGTADVMATIDFYTDRLGFSVLGRHFGEGGRVVAVDLERDYALIRFHQLKLGTAMTSLSRAAVPVGELVVPDVAFSVASLAMLESELRKVHLKFEINVGAARFKRILCRDNNDYLLAFFEV